MGSESFAGKASELLYILEAGTGATQFVNDAVERFVGYRAAEIDELGRPFVLALCHPADRVRLGAHVAALKELPHGASRKVAYRMRHRSGAIVRVQATDTVVDREGDPGGRRILGSVRALGEAAHAGGAEGVGSRLREIVEVQGTQIPELHEVLADLTRVVDRDLTVPLRQLSVLSDLLARQAHLPSAGADQHAELVAMMRAACKQGLDAITHISSMAARRSLAHEEVALAELLQQVIAAQQPLLSELGGQVDTSLACPVVRFPASHVTAITTNLVQNALVHRSPERPPRVTIRSESEGSRVLLEVADNGRGIAPDEAESIFGFAVRGHDAAPGAGLGLYLVRQLLRHMRGGISVESEVGVGSRFRVDFGPHSFPSDPRAPGGAPAAA